jgi:hypothetical protein
MSVGRLYSLTVLTSVLGIVLPLLTILLKLSVNEFENLRHYELSVPLVQYYLSNYPILDISKTLPFLSSLAWHHPWDTHFLRLYVRYSLFNAGVLLVVLLYRRRICGWLGQAVDWLYAEKDAFARRLVFSIVVVLLASYQLKISFGFWFPGIGGWTYESWHPQIQTDLPDSYPAENSIPVDKLNFLEKAVVPEHATYLSRHGYLTGSAMFLHYRNEEVHPANYALTELVFPEYVFGPLYYVFGRVYRGSFRPEVLFRVVKASLAKRNGNRRFLLPLFIAYPNHSVYMKINYTKQPPAESLDKISFWKVTIFVDRNRQIRIVKANEESQISLP